MVINKQSPKIVALLLPARLANAVPVIIPESDNGKVRSRAALTQALNFSN